MTDIYFVFSDRKLPLRELHRPRNCYIRITNWKNADSYRVWIKKSENNDVLIDSEIIKALAKKIVEFEKKDKRLLK